MTPLPFLAGRTVCNLQERKKINLRFGVFSNIAAKVNSISIISVMSILLVCEGSNRVILNDWEGK